MPCHVSAASACSATTLCVRIGSGCIRIHLCSHTYAHAHATQVRRGDLSAATEGVQEGRISTARDVFGLDDGNAAQTTVGSSTDTMFSTLRRLAKVVVSLGQVIASFTRV